MSKRWLEVPKRVTVSVSVKLSTRAGVQASEEDSFRRYPLLKTVPVVWHKTLWVIVPVPTNQFSNHGLGSVDGFWSSGALIGLSCRNGPSYEIRPVLRWFGYCKSSSKLWRFSVFSSLTIPSVSVCLFWVVRLQYFVVFGVQCLFSPLSSVSHRPFDVRDLSDSFLYE